MTNPDTTAALNRILLNAAIKADPIVDRSDAQKEIRIAKMRAELVELGYSIVSSEWLNGIYSEMTAANLKRIAREKTE